MKKEIMKQNAYVEARNEGREEALVTEINVITMQTKQTMLFGAMEIGARLAEAKAIVKHGEWGKWLEERVHFSQRQANNLMALYNEYGKTGLAANSQAIANLQFTQALRLLALPADEREDFAEKNNVAEMKSRELAEKIKELKKDNNAKDKALEALRQEKDFLASQGADLEKKEVEKSKEIKELGDKIIQLELEQGEKLNMADLEKQQAIEQAIIAEKEKLSTAEKEKNDLAYQLREVEQGKAEIIMAMEADLKAQIDKEFQEKFNDEIRTLEKQVVETENRLQMAKTQADEEAEEKHRQEKAELEKKIEEAHRQEQSAVEKAEIANKKLLELAAQSKLMKIDLLIGNLEETCKAISKELTSSETGKNAEIMKCLETWIARFNFSEVA